jgi:uncharacterized membrane-anchored protein YhcB (DUF1043 family)
MKWITAIVCFALGLGICYMAFTLGQVYEKNPDKSQRIHVQTLLDQLKSNNEEIRKEAADKLQKMSPDAEDLRMKLKEVVREGADKAKDAFEWVSKEVETEDVKRP